MNKFLRSLLSAAVFISAMNATATVLTFDRIGYDDPGPGLCLGDHTWPASYGFRVISDSYIPPNYESLSVNRTWFYGSGGGTTPNITASYRLANDAAVNTMTACRFGDLFEVLAGNSATAGEQYIEVTLTADPGYKVHLSSFDLANKIGPRVLPRARVLGTADATLYDETSVPIAGGPSGTHTTFQNSGAGWTAQTLKIRLDAPLDGPLYLTDPDEAHARHISRYGIDNIAFSQFADFAITCPPGLSVQCLANVPPPYPDAASFQAQGGTITGGSGCGSSTLALVSEEVTGGACNKTITRTYRVTQGSFATPCFEAALCTQTITVQDTTAPGIGDPGANETIECPATPVFTAPTTATDNCDPSPTIVLESPDTITPGACAGSYTQTRRWHAVDACGLVSATVSQTITVQDTIRPVIIGAGANTTVECPATPPEFTPPTATDNCDPAPSIEVVSDTTTPLSPPCGNYSRTKVWRAVDACGNVSLTTVSQTITVQDTTRPIISAPPSAVTVQCASQIPVAATLSANDNCSGALTAIASDGLPVGSVPCNYTITRTWNVSDACGNPADPVSQTITVQDTTAPEVSTETPAGSLDRTVECSNDAARLAALGLEPKFTDNCGAVSPTLLSTEKINSPTCPDAYSLVRRWHAVDACGNPSLEFVQTITVQDTTDPVPVCPENKMIVTAGGGGPAFFTATATDNCDPAPTITFYPPSGSTFPMGITPVTCRATDRCGNFTECTFTVTMLGCTAPNLRLTPSVTVTWSCGSLQSAAVISGPYTDVPGATSPHTSPAAGPRYFYRTVGPLSCSDWGLRITPTITIEWDCGILQSAPTVSGPYTDVPDAISPYVIPSGTPLYFRTR